ncbi:calcium-binding protein [Ruegeria atlantica]|uniref:calcium-binding protein n=1 Tax=Ruegeria atlantica TaxID=81569 RepID=UPI001480F258|nr:calcium-binding protein [Ruegeria atlantica]
MTTPVPIGSEFRINSTTYGTQTVSSVTALEDGGFVVTWLSFGQDGSGWGIYGQRYAANGIAQGAEFRVNTTTQDFPWYSSATALADGDFVVTWESFSWDGSRWDVYGQRYAADGSKQGTEFQVNTHTTNDQGDPSVTGLTGGGFVVTWDSFGQDGSGYGVYGQLYTADGTKQGSEFRVNKTAQDSQINPSVNALADGGFVVTWDSDGQDGSGFGVYGQRYAADGSKQGSEFQINTHTKNDQRFASVTALADGGFVVTWNSWGQDGSGFGVYGQLYTADGTKQGSEFRVNAYTLGLQWFSSVTALEDGGFVVTWQSHGQDGSGDGIYGQRYASDGTKQGSEFLVNTTLTSNQFDPSVTGLADGDFVVSWQSWHQYGSGWGVYGERFAVPLASEVGTEGNDTWNGNEEPNRFFGLGGDDILTGRGGDDRLYGGAGNDVLEGGAGADVLDGGAGSDTARYTSSDAGVMVSLADGAGIGGHARGDRLRHIENLEGSRYDDWLFGDAGNNILSGAGGDDTLFGGDGEDTLKGGAGDDRLICGRGNDILSGGAGADEFLFYASNQGDNRIMDFADGEDRIQFLSSTSGSLSFDDLTIADDGQNTTVTWQGGSITLENVLSSYITEDDFLFH